MGTGRYSVMKVESVMQTRQCLPVSLEHIIFSIPGRLVVKEIRCGYKSKGMPPNHILRKKISLFFVYLCSILTIILCGRYFYISPLQM